MKTNWKLLGLLLVTAQPAISATQEITCRTQAPQQTGMVFKIRDTGSKGSNSRELFGGAGRGVVTVRPVRPLKLQYPTSFAVASHWSKRWAIIIFSPSENTQFSFRLTASVRPGGDESFQATIRYGGPNSPLKNAICR